MRRGKPAPAPARKMWNPEEGGGADEKSKKTARKMINFMKGMTKLMEEIQQVLVQYFSARVLVQHSGALLTIELFGNGLS